MSKILFISNISHKIDSFAISSILAAQQQGLEFYHASNWQSATDEEIKFYESEYNIKINNVHISRNPFSKTNITAYREIVDIIKRENIDYIHCNTPVGGLLGRLAGKKCKVKKIIYQVHGFHFYKGAPKLNWLLYYPVERLLARYTDTLITINKDDYELALKKFKLRNNGKIHHVHGVGIDLSQYSYDFNEYQSIRNKKRTELGLSENDVVLISAGRLDLNKNNETTVKALANVPNIKFLLCGDGECRDSLMALAENLGVADRVLFLGNRSDINELYIASDVMIMMSFREGLSRSIMEAMASGLPCIVSKIRGNVDLIENEKGGYLCQVTDVDSLSKSIETLANDISLRKGYGEFNREKVKSFSFDCVTNEITKIYKDLSC